jgi:hypothetical protein
MLQSTLLLSALQAQSSDSSGLASAQGDSTTAATDSCNSTTSTDTTADTTGNTSADTTATATDAAATDDSSTTPEEAAALAAAAEQARHLEAERLLEDRAAKLAAVTAALAAMHSGNAAADLKAGVPMLRVSHLALLRPLYNIYGYVLMVLVFFVVSTESTAGIALLCRYSMST